MCRKAALWEVERYQIVILHREGLSESEISKKVSHSNTEVHRAIIKFKNF